MENSYSRIGGFGAFSLVYGSKIHLTTCLSPSYPCSRGARLLNGVKRGALLAPKEVVIKNSMSFLSVCLFKNGETKTAVVGPFVYVVICKKLGF